MGVGRCITMDIRRSEENLRRQFSPLTMWVLAREGSSKDVFLSPKGFNTGQRFSRRHEDSSTWQLQMLPDVVRCFLSQCVPA